MHEAQLAVLAVLAAATNGEMEEQALHLNVGTQMPHISGIDINLALRSLAAQAPPLLDHEEDRYGLTDEGWQAVAANREALVQLLRPPERA